MDGAEKSGEDDLLEAPDGYQACAALRGGVENLAQEILAQQRDDELGAQTRSHQPLVLGGELVEADQALEALEAEFDLPAQAIEREQRIGGEAAFGQRGSSSTNSAVVRRLSWASQLALALARARALRAYSSGMWGTISRARISLPSSPSGTRTGISIVLP